MSRTLYVSNLPISATEETLKAKFALLGPVVSVRLLTDPATGQSRRCAFVEMQTRAAAHAAVVRLNLAEYDGRLMSVNKALATTAPAAPAR
jgi:RNA recognition motif-containing protein